MAHFYGTIRGNRGEASRLGSRNSGLNAYAASYQGAVDVQLGHDEQDWADVELVPHYGHGVRLSLYRGPVGKFEPTGGVCKELVDELEALVEAARDMLDRIEGADMPYSMYEKEESKRLYDCAGTAGVLLQRLGKAGV